jgi:hypothetical protein
MKRSNLCKKASFNFNSTEKKLVCLILKAWKTLVVDSKAFSAKLVHVKKNSFGSKKYYFQKVLFKIRKLIVCFTETKTCKVTILLAILLLDVAIIVNI